LFEAIVLNQWFLTGEAPPREGEEISKGREPLMLCNMESFLMGMCIFQTLP